MSIQKRRREILKFAETLCESCTIESRGSGHLMLHLAGPAGKRCVTMSATPSDGRAHLNLLSQIRRLAREIGCLPA